jgi:hypothetical protein
MGIDSRASANGRRDFIDVTQAAGVINHKVFCQPAVLHQCAVCLIFSQVADRAERRGRSLRGRADLVNDTQA